MGRLVDHGKHCEWAERIRRRRESGLTVAEFCEWEGMSVASFYNWQKKLRGTTSRPATPSPTYKGKSFRMFASSVLEPCKSESTGTQ